MVVMVIVLVFLHLTVKQAKTEGVKCPSVCKCPNRTVAICSNQPIEGFTGGRDYFESSLEELEFSGNKLTLLDDDAVPTWNVHNLHSLNLSGNRIVNITKYAFQGLGQLEDLDLSRNSLSSFHFEAFYLLLKLAVLRLAGNRLTEIHQATFTELFHLRHLDLSNNSISAIHTETFFNNSDLEWLSLAKNELTEIDPHVFQNQGKLSYLDLSENLITKIEGELFYYNRKLETLLLASNNISEFNASAFYGLENLEYLDLSSNNITFISLSVFQNGSERKCVSKIRHLNLSNNRIHSVNFGECHSCNTTYNISNIFCKIELLDLSENCLPLLDDTLVNFWNTSGALIKHTGNPCPYECSLSQGTYEVINGTSLNCVSQGDIRIKKCNISERNDFSTTEVSVSPTDGTEGDGENKNGPKTSLPANVLNRNQTKSFVPTNIFIFGIYASSVFVAVIMVLVITHVVGKPEPDEFWWEDELAKRNY